MIQCVNCGALDYEKTDECMFGGPHVLGDYWEARNQQFTLERLCFSAMLGIHEAGDDKLQVDADPADPGEDDNYLRREFYVTAPVLEHAPDGSGLVTGVGERKYRVLLEPVD